MDDEEELAFLFKEALLGNGFVVNAFTDPLVALESISLGHLNYRLVLIDIRMDELNGVELATEIHEKDKNIKIILMSAYDPTSVPGCTEYEFVQKPIHIKMLRELVYPLAVC